MGKVIPTAKSMGVGLEQIASGYALMTSKGIATAETTTYMNSMLNEMGKSGTTASKALQEATGKTFQELISSGKSVGDVLSAMNDYAQKNNKSLSDMFGSAEAGKAALILSADAGKDFNNTLLRMKDSAGATDEAFKKVDNTAGTKIKKSLNEVKNAGIKMGDSLAPIVSSLSSAFAKVADKLNGLNEGQRQTIIRIAGILAVIGPTLLIMGKVATSISTIIKVAKEIKTVVTVIKAWGAATKIMTGVQAAFNAVAALNPIVRWTIIIAGVIAAIVLLYKKCEWFRNGINAIGKGIADGCNWLKGKASDLGSKISDTFSNIKSNIGTCMNAAKETVKDSLGKMKQAYTENGGGIKGIVSATMEGVKQYYLFGYNYINKLTGGKFGEMLSTVNSKMEGIKTGIRDKINGARDFFKAGIDKIRGLLNFNWSFPKLKMPHFSVTGKFSLNPPSVPKLGISWYAKAMNNPMLLDSPTIFGYSNGQFLGGGEAGPEIVSGARTLMSMIRQAISYGDDQTLLYVRGIMERLDRYLPALANNQIILDTGEVVGAMAPAMDIELGRISRQKGRGR